MSSEVRIYRNLVRTNHGIKDSSSLHWPKHILPSGVGLAVAIFALLLVLLAFRLTKGLVSFAILVR